MTIRPPIPFLPWIDAHRHLLKPPVGNQVVYRDSEFIVMVVGGPNARSDYHINASEEFFYMIEGDMVLNIVEDGVLRAIPIKEGDIFLLPPFVPHSPQRTAGSIGLVIERQRREGEEDGMRWYCDHCHAILHEEFFPLTDIVVQLREALERFHASEALRTCAHCGHIAPVPPAAGASTARPTDEHAE